MVRERVSEAEIAKREGGEGGGGHSWKVEFEWIAASKLELPGGDGDLGNPAGDLCAAAIFGTTLLRRRQQPLRK